MSKKLTSECLFLDVCIQDRNARRSKRIIAGKEKNLKVNVKLGG